MIRILPITLITILTKLKELIVHSWAYYIRPLLPITVLIIGTIGTVVACQFHYYITIEEAAEHEMDEYEEYGLEYQSYIYDKYYDSDDIRVAHVDNQEKIYVELLLLNCDFNLQDLADEIAEQYEKHCYILQQSPYDEETIIKVYESELY